MSRPIVARRGTTLTELLVALLLLELAGLGALAAALTSERVGRHLNSGSRTDSQRWSDRRAAELDSACVGAASPLQIRWQDSATAARAAVTLAVRCGP